MSSSGMNLLYQAYLHMENEKENIPTQAESVSDKQPEEADLPPALSTRSRKRGHAQSLEKQPEADPASAATAPKKQRTGQSTAKARAVRGGARRGGSSAEKKSQRESKPSRRAPPVLLTDAKLEDKDKYKVKLDEDSVRCDAKQCQQTMRSQSFDRHWRAHFSQTIQVCDYEGCGHVWRQRSNYKNHITNKQKFLSRESLCAHFKEVHPDSHGEDSALGECHVETEGPHPDEDVGQSDGDSSSEPERGATDDDVVRRQNCDDDNDDILNSDTEIECYFSDGYTDIRPAPASFQLRPVFQWDEPYPTQSQAAAHESDPIHPEDLVPELPSNYGRPVIHKNPVQPVYDHPPNHQLYEYPAPAPRQYAYDSYMPPPEQHHGTYSYLPGGYTWPPVPPPQYLMPTYGPQCRSLPLPAPRPQHDAFGHAYGAAHPQDVSGWPQFVHAPEQLGHPAPNRANFPSGSNVHVPQHHY
ncbi:hypothetical protein K474DRAFT_1771946 [Panus rudis PR-1116 ss-1]|nr:hypothetical protein K474DRAFT_1771946 [Panus rudis PR-1116 ss-1]